MRNHSRWTVIALAVLVLVLAPLLNWSGDTRRMSPYKKQMVLPDTHRIVEGARRVPGPLARRLLAARAPSGMDGREANFSATLA